MANCPICNSPLPQIRLPNSIKQALFGYITCRGCQSEVTFKGKLIKKNEEGLKEYENKLYKEEYIKEKARLQAQKEFSKK